MHQFGVLSAQKEISTVRIEYLLLFLQLTTDTAEDLMHSTHKLLALLRNIAFPIIKVLTHCRQLHYLTFEVKRRTPACLILAVKGRTLTAAIDTCKCSSMLVGTEHLVEQMAHQLILLAIITIQLCISALSCCYSYLSASLALHIHLSQSGWTR